MFRLDVQTYGGRLFGFDTLTGIVSRATAALFMIAMMSTVPSLASADTKAMARYAAICEDMSQAPSKEWGARLAANGFSPAPTDLVKARVRDMFLVQAAHTGEALPPGATIDDIVASDMEDYFNPGSFIKARRGPKKAYSNADGAIFLVGTITKREYLGKSRAGLIRCEIIIDAWTNKSRATTLAAEITGIAKGAVRNDAGSRAFYQVRALTVPEPPMVRAQITAVRSKASYPAFTQLQIEHTADLIN